MELSPGTIVDERYEIIRLVGSGGMGTVYQAREEGLNRNLALKFLHQSLLGDDESRARFLQEGRVLSGLAHPNLLKCFRLGLWNETQPYIVMEFLAGESIREILDREQKLRIDEVLQVSTQVVDALGYAERLGVVHRDLKPGNIMIVADSSQSSLVKLVDFGLAKLMNKGGAISQHLTQTGELIGTLLYMSPEVCLGGKADHRSDIYSFGCVLYEMCTAKSPFTGENPVLLMHKHANESAVPLQKQMPPNEVPTGLQELLDKCMAKSPLDRYQSFSDLKSDLELIKAGRGAEVIALSAKSEMRRSKFSPQTMVLVAGAFAVLILVGAISYSQLRGGIFPEKQWTRSTVAVNSGKEEQSSDDRQKQIEDLESSVKRMEQRLSDASTKDEIQGLSDRMYSAMRVLASLYRDQPTNGKVNEALVSMGEQWEKNAIKITETSSAKITRQVSCWAALARGRIRIASQAHNAEERKVQLGKAEEYIGMATMLMRTDGEAVNVQDRLAYLLTDSLLKCAEGRVEDGAIIYNKALQLLVVPRVSTIESGFRSKSDFCDRRLLRFVSELTYLAKPESSEQKFLLCQMIFEGITYLRKQRLYLNPDKLQKFSGLAMQGAFPKGRPGDPEKGALFDKWDNQFKMYAHECSVNAALMPEMSTD